MAHVCWGASAEYTADIKPNFRGFRHICNIATATPNLKDFHNSSIWTCSQIMDILHEAKTKTKPRRLEQRWRKSKLAIYYDLFANQSKVAREMLSQAKSHYYSDPSEKVCADEIDQKALFQIVDKLLHPSQETSLLTHDSLKHLCDSFGIFFQNKIAKIRIELDRRAALAADSQRCQAVNTITSLASLKPVQTSDIIKYWEITKQDMWFRPCAHMDI